MRKNAIKESKYPGRDNKRKSIGEKKTFSQKKIHLLFVSIVFSLVFLLCCFLFSYFQSFILSFINSIQTSEASYGIRCWVYSGSVKGRSEGWCFCSALSPSLSATPVSSTLSISLKFLSASPDNIINFSWQIPVNLFSPLIF